MKCFICSLKSLAILLPICILIIFNMHMLYLYTYFLKYALFHITACWFLSKYGNKIEHKLLEFRFTKGKTFYSNFFGPYKRFFVNLIQWKIQLTKLFLIFYQSFHNCQFFCLLILLMINSKVTLSWQYTWEKKAHLNVYIGKLPPLTFHIFLV